MIPAHFLVLSLWISRFIASTKILTYIGYFKIIHYFARIQYLLAAVPEKKHITANRNQYYTSDYNMSIIFIFQKPYSSPYSLCFPYHRFIQFFYFSAIISAVKLFSIISLPCRPLSFELRIINQLKYCINQPFSIPRRNKKSVIPVLNHLRYPSCIQLQTAYRHSYPRLMTGRGLQTGRNHININNIEYFINSIQSL